jgi:ADP-ribose pyrophosphatase
MQNNFKKDVKIIEQTTCYTGFFKLIRYKLKHKLFAGGWSEEITRELLERGHAVAVLPYDPILDKVILVEQFRIGALEYEQGAWTLETIAGMIESTENSLDVVHREAMEEAGCTISNLKLLYDYGVSVGGSSEKIKLFYGEVDASNIGGIYGLANEGEDILVKAYDFQEAMQLLKNGAINTATAIIALQWLALNRNDIRKK